MGVITNSQYFAACDLRMSQQQTAEVDFATGDRNYVQEWLVQVKTSAIDSLAVLDCPGLPRAGAFYASDTAFDLLSLAIKFSSKRLTDADWGQWLVTVNYSTKLPPGGFPNSPGGPQGDGANNNPELEPPDIEYDYEVGQEAPQSDLDKKAYLNSAKLPFSPPPKFPAGYPILMISRNELGFNTQRANQYAFALNSDIFMGYRPETVMCYPPKAKLVFKGPLQYWRVTYRLKFAAIVTDKTDKDYAENAQGQPIGLRNFQPHILDQGSMQLKADGTYEPVYVHNSRHIDLLDGAGRQQKAPLGQLKKGFFLPFRQFRTMPFKRLIVKGLS